MKPETVVILSGGFDPVHIGHIRMINEAKKLGDYLIIILNNDNWITKKKGCVFMGEEERREILESLYSVDKVMITEHKKNTQDKSVCKEIRKIFDMYADKNIIFGNGGDRYAHNIPEYDLCKELGIEMQFNLGGEKIRSSSELVKEWTGQKG